MMHDAPEVLEDDALEVPEDDARRPEVPEDKARHPPVHCHGKTQWEQSTCVK